MKRILRLLRFTKWLPLFKGLTLLLRCYKVLLPASMRIPLRIDDFDDDLRLNVSLCETIGINLWHAPRLFEKEERRLFCAAVEPGCTVLDVGANIGIYTLLAAKRGATVFAIEADPQNAAMLRHHVEINGFTDRVIVIDMAAVEETKEVCLYRNAANSGGSNIFSGDLPAVVRGATIDSLALPPIDLCKMDIEGAELAALCGMRNTLAHSPNMKMLIECSSHHASSDPLVAFLREVFAQTEVVGRQNSTVPAFCNIWAHGLADSRASICRPLQKVTTATSVGLFLPIPEVQATKATP